MNTTIPWYQSAIIRQQIVAFIIEGLGLLGITTDIDIDGTIAAIFAGIGALIPIYTIITRLFKPSPNITQTSIDKEKELVAKGTIPDTKKQGGFVRPLMLALLLACVGVATMTMIACTHTAAAYKAAARADDKASAYALVVLEHYDALLIEATNLKNVGSVPTKYIESIKSADLRAQPFIDSIRPLQKAFASTGSASDAVALQKAVDNAIKSVADLVLSIKAAKGGL